MILSQAFICTNANDNISPEAKVQSPSLIFPWYLKINHINIETSFLMKKFITIIPNDHVGLREYMCACVDINDQCIQTAASKGTFVKVRFIIFVDKH